MIELDLILLNAGQGNRARCENFNYPKQMYRLGGKPIFILLIELFRKIKEIDKIIVTIPLGMNEFTKIINNYNLDVECVLGGVNRQESVSNALSRVTSDRVIIHESARPFVTLEFINRLLYAEGNCIVPVISSIPTIFYKDRYLDRDEVYQIQLPQVFDTKILKEAHLKAGNKIYNDDSSLVFEQMNVTPVFIEGLEDNFKITLPSDLKRAEVTYNEFGSSVWR